MNGWKEYFAKMSEKQKMAEMQEDVNFFNDSTKEDWSSKGRLKSLQVSAEEYGVWCKPYPKSLIVKLMRKFFSMNFMKQRIEHMGETTKTN